MALVLKDRVKETSTTAGTGTLTLAGAVAGFQAFSAVGNGNTTYYAIVDAATGDWEVGLGTYTSSGTTLSRTTVLSSSNGGSLVPFASNAKDVFVTYPSEKSAYQDAAGVIAQTSFGAITATSAALTSGTITTVPTNNTDIVNKQYADAIASGIHFHEAVGYATTAALPACTYANGASGVGATLTGNANGALTIDSYTFTSPADDGTRVLIKNEVNSAHNGVYTLSQAGNSSPGAPFILIRATDFDTVGTGVDQIDEGDFFLVTGGTANINTAWVQQTAPPITIGTTPIVFQQFSAPITYTAGTGLSESPSYTFNIANTGVTATTYGSASSVPVIAVNAQGQITSATDTAIAINGSAVTGNISGQAGSVANALTAGTYLTSGGTYDGSAARTFAVDATSANTASKVVARDSNGDFSAGTITATLSGSATSSGTATNVAGGAANQIPYQTGAATTSFITAPTTAGYALTWNGSAFAWANSIATATTANNIAGGTTGSLPYNSAAGSTTFLGLGTAGQVLTAGASAPQYVDQSTLSVGSATTATTATKATNIAGGGTYQVVYQTSTDSTAFVTNGTTGQVLTANSSGAPSWQTPSGGVTQAKATAISLIFGL